MKNTLIIFWGILIISLCLGVFSIGIYEEKNKDVLSVKREFIESSKKYIKSEDKKMPTKNKDLLITYDEMLSLDYIGIVKYKDKECTGTITVKKVFIFYKYNTNITCE